jgi:uncharacterized protein (TIGR04255 family)
MDVEQRSLPDFRRPPVVEVALSVQFEPIAALRNLQMGLIWEIFRTDFPGTEEHPPLAPAFEEFGIPSPLQPRIRVERVPPVPRCWFLSADGTQLIQVQQDRIVHNWRRGGADASYPRYGALRDRFRAEIDKVCRFLARERLGELRLNQCEVTYINEVALDGQMRRHGQLEELLTVWRPDYSDGFLPEPGDVSLTARYVIPDPAGNPIGRLNVALRPAYRTGDSAPVMILEPTARGKPLQDDVEGAFQFLDLGHEWVVRGFASITTSSMHSQWDRTNDD